MAVTNFNVETRIDGRSTTMADGPVSREGGFSTVIRIRDGGKILRAITVTGTATPSGELELTAALGDIDAGDPRVKADVRSFTIRTHR